MLMSLDLKYPRVFIASVLASQSGSCAHGMKHISSLQLYHIFKDHHMNRFPGSDPWEPPHRALTSTTPVLFTIFQLSFGNRSHMSYSDESSSAPRSVLKSSDVTRERCKHVTVLVFG